MQIHITFRVGEVQFFLKKTFAVIYLFLLSSHATCVTDSIIAEVEQKS